MKFIKLLLIVIVLAVILLPNSSAQAYRRLFPIDNMDMPGMDYKWYILKSADPQLCANDCSADYKCNSYTFAKLGAHGSNSPPVCYLKSGIPALVSNTNCVSGYKPPMSTEVDTDRPGMDYKIYETTNNYEDCQWDCSKDPNCMSFTYARPGAHGPNSPPVCYLKSGEPAPVSNKNCCVSGRRIEPESPSNVHVRAPPTMTYERGADRPGMDYKHYASDYFGCSRDCGTDPECMSFTYGSECYLKSDIPALISNKNCVSGVKYPYYFYGGVDSANQRQILERHNYWREQVGVGLNPLQWDNGLADSALSWAKHLYDNPGIYPHDPNWSKGENVAQGHTSWIKAIDDWASEKKCFQNKNYPDIYNHQCDNDPDCINAGKDWNCAGHYSQIVWRTNTHVGCGKYGGKYVCRYSPGGNNAGIPY